MHIRHLNRSALSKGWIAVLVREEKLKTMITTMKTRTKKSQDSWVREEVRAVKRVGNDRVGKAIVLVKRRISTVFRAC